MYLKKSHNWVEIILWLGVIVTLGVLGYAIWYKLIDLSIAALLVLLTLAIFLGYIKYAQIMAVKRKFVIAQETLTILMLVYFSYYYFSNTQEVPGEKTLNDTRKKIEDVYEKSRFHMTMPLIFSAVKTFSEIKNIKDVIKSQVKDFSDGDGFNMDNIQNIAQEVGNLFEKIQQLTHLVTKGFSSKKSLEQVMDNKASDELKGVKKDVSGAMKKAKDVKKAVSNSKKTKTVARKLTAKTKSSKENSKSR